MAAFGNDDGDSDAEKLSDFTTKDNILYMFLNLLYVTVVVRRTVAHACQLFRHHHQAIPARV